MTLVQEPELRPTPARVRRVAAAMAVLVAAVAIGLALNHLEDEISIGQSAQSAALAVLSTYFWICLFGTLAPSVVFLALRRRAKPLVATAAPPPFVSIVIPAYNEEEKIAQAIDAALNQDYPAFEVIVVDDGSKDFTRFIAENYGVRLIRQKQNGGKFRALNAGAAAARGDIVVTSDSDSLLDRGVLKCLAAHFQDPTVGAVAGAIRPLSSRGLVRKLQAIEYIWGQEVIKLAQTGSGASITVCPGPVTAFRRSALEDIGGFKGRTITEDFDATLDTIAAGWKVAFEPRAVALTDAPKTLRSLARQRLRWNRGTLQAFGIHRTMFFDRSTGLAGLVWLPWFFFTAYGLLALDLAVLALFLPLAMMGASMALLAKGLIYILIIEAVVVFQYLLGLFLAGERRGSLYFATVFMKVFNLLLAWTRIKAVYVELRGKAASW